MKKVLRNLTVLTMATAITLPVAAYQRGRVQIRNNTVVSDQGTRLRALDFFIWNGTDKTKYSVSTELWSEARKRGFNCVRLSVIFDHRYSPHQSIESTFEPIERAVECARQNSMYICIDYHDCASYKADHMKEFWRTIAPKYADETHVIYELVNEPVAWSADKYQDHHLRDFEAGYQICHEAAPETHVILMSYAQANGPMLEKAQQLNGIDWTNASVGFHPYATRTFEPIRKLKAELPCIATEFIALGAAEDDLMAPVNGDRWWVKHLEELEISWFLWFNGMRTDKWSQVDRQLHDAKERGYYWEHDDFVNPPTGNEIVPSERRGSMQMPGHGRDGISARATFNLLGQQWHILQGNRVQGENGMYPVILSDQGSYSGIRIILPDTQ
jgi:hypothetical protein